MTYERAAIFMLGGGPQAHEVCCRNFLAGNRVDLIADAFNMWTKVVMSTVFLKNISDFGKTNEVYATYFKANPPARTKVGVAALPGDALVGIDVIAQQ